VVENFLPEIDCDVIIGSLFTSGFWQVVDTTRIHKECEKPYDNHDREFYEDKDEKDGHNNCNNDRMSEKDLFDWYSGNNNHNH